MNEASYTLKKIFKAYCAVYASRPLTVVSWQVNMENDICKRKHDFGK